MQVKVKVMNHISGHCIKSDRSKRITYGHGHFKVKVNPRSFNLLLISSEAQGHFSVTVLDF